MSSPTQHQVQEDLFVFIKLLSFMCQILFDEISTFLKDSLNFIDSPQIHLVLTPSRYVGNKVHHRFLGLMLRTLYHVWHQALRSKYCLNTVKKKIKWVVSVSRYKCKKGDQKRPWVWKTWIWSPPLMLPLLSAAVSATATWRKLNWPLCKEQNIGQLLRTEEAGGLHLQAKRWGIWYEKLKFSGPYIRQSSRNKCRILNEREGSHA